MKWQKTILWFVGLVLLITPVFAEALQKPDHEEKAERRDLVTGEKLLRAVRIKNEKIKIDGILDEPLWRKITPATGFVQQEPNEGEPATEKTEVYVAYDDDAIYVAIYAHDSNPAEIKGLLARRDEEPPSDWVGIAFDSYADQRTAFEFGVNPAGVKVDALWSNDTNRDKNWDAVWDVATRIVEDGWIAEFRIPLSQLRFSKNGARSWGFQVRRVINRKNELDYWRHVPKDASGMVSLYGKLAGINDLPEKKHLQIMPYGVASADYRPAESDNPFTRGGKYDYRAGIDLKYGVTSNLTLDATINPDFGQVEADPSEFNLTAYETYFEEKRPFFIEGSNIFNYSIGVGDGDLGDETLFYSRRIGRVPQYYPDVPSDGHVDFPRQTRILGAAKLTGKTDNGLSIGILEAVTGEERAAIAVGTRKYKEIVEPLTNYFVARVQKDFNEGRTAFGGIVTSVIRDIPNENLNFLNRRAYSGGLDFFHRWHNNEYIFNAKLLGSYVTGHKEAIQRLQKSSARYYQRPDAPHVKYDPNRTSLSGYAGTFILAKMGGGHWRFGLGNLFRSTGFEVNDLGFMRTADFIAGFVWVGYRQYIPGSFYRQYSINHNLWYVSTFGNERIGTGGNLNCNIQFLNYWRAFMGVNREMPRLNTGLLRGGPSFKEPGSWSVWAGIRSDSRKKISGGAFTNYHVDDQGFYSFSFNPNLTIRPSGRFNMSLFVNYNPSTNDRQYIGHDTDDEGDHYIFGRLHRKTFVLVMRLNYTLTPNLSIQFYGQPFVTAGAYSDFREIADPLADAYSQRFRPYDYSDSPDFNFRQFRSNLVVRWEYSPGSVVYLVWSQGRTDFKEDGRFRLRNDLTSLFDTRAENVFLIKANRWFSL